MKYIYCDESCHLEHDSAKAMLLGAISCSASEKKRVCEEIRRIKERHGLSTWSEIKWTGVSPSKVAFYVDLINYFADEAALSFRAVVIKDKSNLNHAKYNKGSHDLWYYKAYFYLLDAIICYSEEYTIYVDIKDTRGGPKVAKLREVLCNNIYDFKKEVIKGIYQIRSHESEILQLTDLIMGAIGYYHNEKYMTPMSSSAKNAVVATLMKHYGRSISNGTYRGTRKMDVFLWKLGR